MFGAKVHVIEFDAAGAVFFYTGDSPSRWDLLVLVAVGQPFIAPFMAALVFLFGRHRTIFMNFKRSCCFCHHHHSTGAIVELVQIFPARIWIPDNLGFGAVPSI